MTSEILDQIIDYSATSEFSGEVIKAREEYKNHVGQIYEDDQSYENCMRHFLEWYIFDRKVSGKTSTPLAEYIHKKSDEIPDKILQDYQNLTQNIHGIFQIKKIAPAHVIAYDYFTKRKYKVVDEQSQMIFRKNDLFEARIIPSGKIGRFTGVFFFHPQESKKFIKKEIEILTDQLKQYELQLKKHIKEKLLNESKLKKLNIKLKSINQKIDNTNSEAKINKLKNRCQEIDSNRISLENIIININESIIEIETIKIQDEGQKTRNQLMFKLARMSLKWERFRKIDIKDIYKN